MCYKIYNYSLQTASITESIFIMHSVTGITDSSLTTSNTILSISSSSSSSPVIDFDSPRTTYTFSPDLDFSAFTYDETDPTTTASLSPTLENLKPETSTKATTTHNHRKRSSIHMGRNEKDDDYELRIAAGIEIVKSGTVSIRAAAKKVRVSHETLRRRFQGASSRQEFHTQLMALTPNEEQLIENMVLTFQTYGNMLTSSFLCNLVNDYRRQKPGSMPVKDLGISWTAGFRRRHEAIGEIMSKSMNKDKSDCLTKSTVEQWYSDVGTGFAKYNVFPENVYNLVELGYFADTNSHAFSCFKKSEVLKSVDSIDIALSSLEAICGDGTFVPPMVIVKGNSNTNFVSEATDDYGALTSTIDGRANSISFYDWLEYVFEPATAAKAGSGYRAIFVDPNPVFFSSQVLQFALNHNIIFYLLPQQTPYVLQPVESGVLSAFCQEIRSLSLATPLMDHNGKVNWDECFAVLQNARMARITRQTVTDAWQSTGILPVDASRAILSGSSSYSLTSAHHSELTLPTTISMDMISDASTGQGESFAFKEEPEDNMFVSRHSGSPPINLTFTEQPMTTNSSSSDSSYSTVLSSLQQTSVQSQALLNLGTHYRLAFNRYLSTRPSMYYEDGSRADIEEETYLRQFMDNCWSSLDRAIQAVVDSTNQSEKQIKELMRQM